jgi:hypothetical protein
MIYFNLAGIVIGLLGGLVAGAVTYAIGDDDMTLATMTWLAVVALAGAV